MNEGHAVLCAAKKWAEHIRDVVTLEPDVTVVLAGWRRRHAAGLRRFQDRPVCCSSSCRGEEGSECCRVAGA